jgi:hypothetical protein
LWTQQVEANSGSFHGSLTTQSPHGGGLLAATTVTPEGTMNAARFATVAAAVFAVAACQEAPTAPQSLAFEPNSARKTHWSDHDNTIVTFNSASCTLVNAATGSVQCSWDISNGPNPFNVYPEALLDVTYNCVNPSNGRIASTSNRERWVWSNGVEGITTGTSVETNHQLNPPNIWNSYTGKDKKFNACKGSQVVSITNTSMLYWDLYVDNWYDGQPWADYRYGCFASDARYECLTPF